MKRGSSESITSGAHSPVMPGAETSSDHHVSRPSVMGTAFQVLLTTMTSLTAGHSARATSQFFFMGMVLPPRTPSSDVMTRDEAESRTLSFRDAGLKPPQTTLCTAPMRAQARIDMRGSGIMGMYTVPLSPFLIPFLFNTLARRQTS